MKKSLLLFALLPLTVLGQGVFPYMDFNNFFRVYTKGGFSQIEHQQTTDVFFGDEFVAYNNSQRDFKIYYNGQSRLLTNQNVSYKASDHLLVWNIGPIINYFEDGKTKVLTSFGGEYAVGDSLIVYQDTRYKTVNVIYRGQNIELYQLTGEMYMPEVVGDNIVAFRDNGDLYKVFWRGQIYELGVYSGNQPRPQFFAGTDMLAFNDPSTRTFAVFEDGQFLDVEDLFAAKIRVGRDFVVYESTQGNLHYYRKGKNIELATFFQSWDARDDLVVWVEANSTYAMEADGERKKVANYSVTDFKLKNDVLAFRNQLNGISGFRNGITKDITNLLKTEYAITGHAVCITLQNRSVIVWDNNQIYND